MAQINLGPFTLNIPEKPSIPGLIINIIADKIPAQIVTLNSLMFNAALRDDELGEAVTRARLIVADSVGIVWAARFITGKKVQRTAGIDLMADMCSLAEEHGWPVYLFGSGEGVAKAAANTLRLRFNGLKIAGTRNGYFTKEQENSIIKAISETKPAILFVGMPSPLQEKWIRSNLQKLGAPAVMGVGGSFDVLSGKLKRAPIFMRHAGLEWLFRLFQEPKRIWRMTELPVFVLNILKLKLLNKAR
jgi:N-acetylglucosaminyldiphosphoundecaprenol N-acetyl-beta-D-mannosaminyltransferase